MPSDPSTRPLRVPRTVRAERAFAWYAEAMRLFKRHPFGFAGLALAVVIAELALSFIPVIGRPAANIIVPLVACSLLYASLATDRDDRPRLRHLLAPFAAPVPAIMAMVIASLAVFFAEWLVAWRLAGINLLDNPDPTTLRPALAFAIYGTGVAISLPLTLVPMLAFFEQASVTETFAGSMAAFVRNIGAFLLYGALSLALLGIAFVTWGMALAIVLPLWAASSYAAWKNLFDLDR